MIVCLRQFVESEGSYDIDDLTCLGTKYQQCKFTRTLRCYSLSLVSKLAQATPIWTG